MRADNEVSQNDPETELSTPGRSIGSVRDQSAPTGDWIILRKAITGRVRDQSAHTDVQCML